LITVKLSNFSKAISHHGRATCLHTFTVCLNDDVRLTPAYINWWKIFENQNNVRRKNVRSRGWSRDV